MDAASVKKERNKPCEQCRARKVKCTVEDGSSVCARCLSQSLPCIFTNAGPLERKRPSPSSGSVDSQQSGPKRRSNGLRSGRSEVVSPASNAQSTGRDEAVPPNSLLNRTIGLAKGFHATHIGASSAFPRLLFDLTPNRTAWKQGDVRRVSHEEFLHTLNDAATQDYERDFECLDEIEACVAPHGRSLINLYFRIVHPSYPILHKKVFYEKYARTYREFSPPLLAAVYIQALKWWEYARELQNAQKPSEKQLKKLAHDSLSGVCQRPKLSTVQALLLLAQSHDEVNWMLLAQATNVGFELGLHLDCSQWIIPTWEKGLRKRLAWAVFMQDAWGALLTGRPALIHINDWMVQHVTESDFPESSEDEDAEEGSTEVEKGRELFTHFISLSQLLSQIIDNFWTLTAQQQTQKGNLGAALEKAKPLQIMLKDWYSQLPVTLSLDNIQARKLCSVGYLHLGYYAAQVTLHRALLNCSSLAYGSAMCEYDLLAFCQNAAIATFSSATTLLNKLRPEHLQSFWYFASSHNLTLISTLGCELWAASLSQSERNNVQKLLEDFRWALRISAKGVVFLDPAVESLTQMMQLLQEAENEQRNHPYHNLRAGTDWSDSRESFPIHSIEADGVVDNYYYPSYGDAGGFVAQDYYRS